MPIIKEEMFYCPKCDYITHSKSTIDRIKETGKCPACSGEHQWVGKFDKQLGSVKE